MKNTKKLTTMAITISFALILSYIESRIPAFVAIPGIKAGLANIAVIFALYKLGVKEAAIISVIRVLLVSTLFGTPVSLIYSLSGAILSLTVMITLKKLTPLGEVAVSVCGGVLHNLGQILVAAVLMKTAAIGYYMIVLTVTGVISGVLVGLCGALLLRYIKYVK